MCLAKSSQKPIPNNYYSKVGTRRLPSLIVSDGAIEAVKWLALVLMTLDHVNKYLFAEKLPFIFECGRLTMPLFAFALAYNLARPGTMEKGGYIRTMKRMMLSGLLATPAFIGLGGLIAGWWPLNIMFALLIMTATTYLLDRGTINSYIIAILVFIIGGSSVEFWWPGITIGIAAWSYCKKPNLFSIIILIAALTAMRIINGNYWALAALPVALSACFVSLNVPRLKMIFYIYYPLHLSVLWIAKAVTN